MQSVAALLIRENVKVSIRITQGRSEPLATYSFLRFTSVPDVTNNSGWVMTNRLRKVLGLHKLLIFIVLLAKTPRWPLVSENDIQPGVSFRVYVVYKGQFHSASTVIGSPVTPGVCVCVFGTHFNLFIT